MKKLAVLFLALGFTVSAAAQERTAKLTRAPILTEVREAVELVYELGRGEADSGGIASIRRLSSDGSLSTFEIIRQVMSDGGLAGEAKAIADITCEERVFNDCVRGVVEHSEDVRANFQPTDVREFIRRLLTWRFTEEMADQWADALGTIDGYVLAYMGEGYQTYSYGYDDVADTFTLILISKDRKNVLVFTGDVGA